MSGAIQEPTFDTGIAVAHAFLEDFSLSGRWILRAAAEAIDLRAKLRGLHVTEAFEEISKEYTKYCNANADFKKGPEKWLAECNSKVKPRRSNGESAVTQ